MLVQSSLESSLFVVYYRIYTEEGNLGLTNAFSASDPYLGRIGATLVPPPHVASSVKRCLAKLENIDIHTDTSLFLTPSSEHSMEDSAQVAVLKPGGPGSNSQEPLVLFAKLTTADRTRRQISSGIYRIFVPLPRTEDHEERYRKSVSAHLKDCSPDELNSKFITDFTRKRERPHPRPLSLLKSHRWGVLGSSLFLHLILRYLSPNILQESREILHLPPPHCSPIFPATLR